MSKTIIIGHKNPDTDTVISSIVLSSFLNKRDQDTVARIPGEINRETLFILEELGEEFPSIITEEEVDNNDVFLVDHNDLSQSVAKKENVIGVLDHHLLSGTKTDKPIFFRVEPVGSTSTLVYKLMKESGVAIEEKEAALLLTGVISDTLNLNSPTTTSEDIDAYYELKDISKKDPNVLAVKMFEAKSDFSGKSVKEIISGDLKAYDFGGKKIGIGVAETTAVSFFLENENNILEEIKKMKDEEGFHSLFFGAVDIVKQNTYFYPAGEEEKEVVKNLFQGEDKGAYFFLKGIASRKKEIAPPLSDYYEKLN